VSLGKNSQKNKNSLLNSLFSDLQNTLFGVFEDLLRARIEGAIASGTYDLGVETVTAESLTIAERRTLYVHPETGAETMVFAIRRRDRNQPFTLAEALERAGDAGTRLLINPQSAGRPCRCRHQA
jgi:protein strawberry notch